MRIRIPWLLALCMVVAARTAPAQSFHTFTAAGNVSPYFDPIDWGIPLNWSGNTFPPSNINTGIVIGASVGVSNNNLGTFILNDLQFNIGTTLAGNPLDLRASLGASLIVMNTNSAVTINNNLLATGADIDVANVSPMTGAITLAGPISGTGGLEIGNGGAATVTLSSTSNTYSGPTTIYGGTLNSGAYQALPMGTNVRIISGTWKLNVHDQSIGSLTLSDPSTTASSGNAIVNLGGAYLFLGGNVSYNPSSTSFGVIIGDNGSGHIDLYGATRTFTIGSGSDGARNGVDVAINTAIVGTGGLIKAGPGILLAGAGAWTYTGSTQITGGALSVTAVNQLPPGTAMSLSNGSTFNLGFPNPIGSNSYNQTIGSLAGTSGTTVNLMAATLTVGGDNTNTNFAGKLTGQGGAILKVGAGTLTLNGTSNDYTGGTTINGGTLVAAADSSLGTAPVVTVGPLGTLAYSGSPVSASRVFSLAGGTLGATSGASVILVGSTVTGGYLSGPGVFSTGIGAAAPNTFAGTAIRSSAGLSLNNADTLLNVTNNGQLSTAGFSGAQRFIGVTNGAAGRMNLGTTVNATDFISYGQINISGNGLLANVGTSGMVFGGGSTTFVGAPASQSGIVDLGGRNLLVRGGLFVNNGAVADSTATPGSVIVDFGGLYKGAGTNFVNVVTQNGGKVQAGNSPGSMGFGRFVFGPGGVNNYVFAIDDATGTAGPSPDAAGHVSGWGLVKAVKQTFGSTTTSGDLVWTATPSNKLTFALDTLVNPTLVGTDVGGPMDNFDPAQAYAWPAVHWEGTYSGPTDSATLAASTSFDTRGFLNAAASTFGWSLELPDHTLSLTYTPTAVPEPGTLTLAGVAAIGWVTFWRRRWQSNGLSANLSA